MTSLSTSTEMAGEARAPASAVNDKTALQPGDVDLEVGEHPQMQAPNALSELAVAEVYTVFTRGQITFIAIMASISTFYSPLTANIYFPALNTISAELGVSETQVNLTVTTYMVIMSPLAV